MRLELKIALFVSLFAFLAFAVYDEQTLNFSVSEVPGLVSVTTNIDTTGLLPNYEYNYNLSIAWAVPPHALQNIDADSVTLFVKVYPAANVTNVYFRDAELNRTEGVRYFRLFCKIEDGTCSNASVLAQGTQVFYTLVPGKNITMEQLFVSAQLGPFANESVVAAADRSMRDANSSLRELDFMGLDTPEDSLLFGKALERYESGDYEAAKELADRVTARRSAIPSAEPTSDTGSPLGSAAAFTDALGPLAYAGIILALLLLCILGYMRLAAREKRPRPRPRRREVADPDAARDDIEL